MRASLIRVFTAASALIASAVAGASTAGGSPTVKLSTGATLTGAVDTSSAGTEVDVYLGIPYADAPIGDKRWKQTALKTLKHDLNATSYGSICHGNPAFDVVSGEFPPSEDCLYLNVYTPAGAKRGAKLPVMIWLYGGGFVAGAANAYNCTSLVGASDQKAVIVTFNYRIGVFGFLSNKEILGEGDGANFGLRDQEIAFQWVQQNIESFGGNPKDITAFGQSAGAISIALHMLARDGSQQVFHRAILESGAHVVFQMMAMSAQQETQTATIAAAVGCNNTQGSVLSCLREANASAVFAASTNLNMFPTIDKVFLQDVPILHLLRGKVSKIPTLMGTNTDEGWLFTLNSTKASQFESFIHSNYPLMTESEFALLAELYPAENFPTPEHRVSQIAGDYTFVCPSEFFTNVLVPSVEDSYRYRFNYTSDEYGYPLVPHLAELDYVFDRRANLRSDNATRTVVRYFQKYWTNFGVTGSPNGAETRSNKQSASGYLAWPKYTPWAKQEMVLQPKLVTEMNGAYMPGHPERCAFWYAFDLRTANESPR